jgi:hypothetical protein
MNPWIPSTEGEKLLFLLADSFRRPDQVGSAAFRPDINYSRSSNLADYFASAYLLNMFARAIRVGEQVVHKLKNETQGRLVAEMKYELTNRLDLLESDFKQKALERIATAVISAVFSVHVDISSALRKTLKEEFPNPVCYLCGNQQGWRKSGPYPKATLDHIWPAAWGGDSVQDNLLPACSDCNTKRNDPVSWEWDAAHAVVGPHDPGGYLAKMPRPIKNSLHLRAVMSYASANRVTLRNAALFVGPVLVEPVKLDARDTTDYFNLHGHDVERFDPQWSRE